MFTLSNLLSLLRGPLALLYLIPRPEIRLAVVLAASLTDMIDGYLARRYKFTTRLGAILDPLMDKFFVFFILGILFYEKRILDWQVLAMLSRDIAIITFGTILFSLGRLKKYHFQSMYSGKLMTALQFCVIFFLSLHYFPPTMIYFVFFILGPIVLFELFLTLKSKPENV